MSQDVAVTAADIARLVDVGRAAVSNWRRRYHDFPAPIGGTASSPLFSLPEVENWLRCNGKSYRLAVADRAWQRLRATGTDLLLGDLLAKAGVFLVNQRAGHPTDDMDPELAELLTELATEQGHLGAFELLCDRYTDAHSRRLAVTPPELAGLLSQLIGLDNATVFDPACGLGALLVAAPGLRAWGQDVTPAAATICAVRLSLRDMDNTIITGSSLREDGFTDRHADAVVCDPPVNERAWGHPELAGDPRWEYGFPPRGESELAWVQHCLTHVRPGGPVAILMPTSVASRRAGRRIRGNLLRAGALRAVLTLRPGGPDLWLLRRPVPGEQSPAHLLLLDAGGDLNAVLPAWQRFQREPADSANSVRIIDLLDDDVDLGPARHRPGLRDEEFGQAFAGVVARFRSLSLAPPTLTVCAKRTELPQATIGELVKAGLIEIQYAAGRMLTGDGEVAVLTAEDLAEGRPPSEWTTAEEGLVQIAPGDVVATPTGVARVVGTDVGPNTVLGPGLARYRLDPDRLDPDFLAGFLRATPPRAPGGSSRIDTRRTRLPWLPLERQRDYGRAFRALTELADAVRATAELGETLVGLGFDGLVEGYLRPQP